jgi:uncharacterized protein (DUF302 family)
VRPVLLAAAALLAAATTVASPAAPGVYQYVVQKAEGTVEQAAEAVAAAAPAAGFQVLARVASTAPSGCGFRAEVVVLHSPDYGRQVLAANRRTGPFAVVDRVAVFQDERGVHVSVLNPRSILRTVLMDDQKHAALVEAHLSSLRSLVSGAVRGAASSQDYGQAREKGYIGKTMGVMAGGPFAEKVKDVAVVGGEDWKGTAERVRAALEKKGPKWGLHLAYALEIPEAETVVLGSTGTPMDSQSFQIVGAGADSSRDGMKCPGLAHAGAYPIEVVVAHEGGSVRVRVVDTMYRMKMYFEDAGKWAFMKNMGMPGSIQDEIAAQVRVALAAR